MSYESWIGSAGLIVAVCSIILTVTLRLYDYHKQGSQRRIDRIGNALRQLQPLLSLAKASYQEQQTNVPALYSLIAQICKIYGEAMSKGLEVDLKKEASDIFKDLKVLDGRYTDMYRAYIKKSYDPDFEQNAEFDMLRGNVVNDSEIKRLIKELLPMVDKWLEKHP